MRNIRHGRPAELPGFRKIAIGSWRHPRDPSTYASVDFVTEPAEAFIAARRSVTPITLVHYVVKILAHCVLRQPGLNQVLLRDRLYPRESIGVFTTALVRDRAGMDASGFLLADVPALTLTEVAEQSGQALRRLRRGEDAAAARVARRLRGLPFPLLRGFFRLMEFLQFTLNLAPAALGIPADRFGTVIVTDIGALGLVSGYAPLAAFSRCPFAVCVGRPRKAPYVDGDRLVVRSLVTISFTMDHRYIDAAHGAAMLKRFRRVFEHPERHAEAFDGAPHAP